MYLKHFHFREYPFSLTPDPEFFFGQTDHLDALNVLQVALRSGQSFVKVTGEIGLGKTLLCRTLLRELDREFLTAYIPNPQLSRSGLTRAMAHELDIAVPPACTDEQVMQLIQTRLINIARRGKRVVLILDEAQQLPEEALEAVRLLSNLETEKFKLLQIVLVGQPELDRRLNRRSMRQFKQRIVYSCRVTPLDRVATASYIAHRLQTAGCKSGALLTPAAVDTVFAASRGVPRLINIICHKALMAAFGRGEASVNVTHVRRAIADTESVRGHRFWAIAPRLLAARLTALGTAAASLSAMTLLPWIHR